MVSRMECRLNVYVRRLPGRGSSPGVIGSCGPSATAGSPALVGMLKWLTYRHSACSYKSHAGLGPMWPGPRFRSPANSKSLHQVSRVIP
jgi:hypothetical protein